jgi:putative transposase
VIGFIGDIIQMYSPRKSKTMKRIIFDFWGNENKRFNEGQIIKAIKEHEGGRKAEDIVRDLGIIQGTFYKWKQKYGGMEASDVRRLKDLELENGRLKRLLADTILDKEILKEVIEKKGSGPTSGGSSSR